MRATTESIGFIEINPQFGWNNRQQEGSLTPLLIGVVIGIVVSKWFL